MALASFTSARGSTAVRVVCTLACAAAFLLPAHSVRAEPFTLVVMPDTQTESTNTPQVRFPAMTQWIADNETARNIKFVAHVGDLVNWETPNSNPPQIQYVNASAAMQTLDMAGIPYAIAIGNHDTAAVGGVLPDGGPCHCGGSAGPGNVRANLRNTTVFNQFFPLARFTACRGQYQPPKVDNTFHTFSAGGVDWLVITAELDPRPGVLPWFNQVVTDHPDHNVIYVTHNYLAPSGNLAGPVGYGDSSPQAIWDGLIKLHGNIRFVLSGHLTQTALRQTPGNSGRTVYQLLTDYQDEGNGWLRTLEIDPQARTVKSEVYSPYLRQFKMGPSEQFTLQNVEFIPAKAPPDAGADGGAGATGQGGSAGSAGVGGSGAAGSAGASATGGAGGLDPETGGSPDAGGGGGSAQGSAGASTAGGAGPDASAGTGASAGAGRGAPLAGDGSGDESGCGCRLADQRQRVSILSLAALLIAASRFRRLTGRSRG